MWRGKLLTVSKPLLKQSPVTTHCKMCHAWAVCPKRWVVLRTSCASSTPDVADSNWSARWRQRVTQKLPAFQQASLTPPALLCFQSATIKVSITLMSDPPGGHKPQRAGAKQRRSSCSAFTYWPITAGAINWRRVESRTSGPWSSPDIQITRHLTLCVAYGRNKWNLLT